MSSSEASPPPLELVVDQTHAGERLDAFLVHHFPRYSRVHLRKVIAARGVLVDGQMTKVAYRLRTGQRVTVTLPPLPRQSAIPEDIPLDILFEDEYLIALNKPAKMVVHPARGHWSGTLTSALAFHFDKLSAAGGPTRPGIVHRLDRETSGVLVVAKTDPIHFALSAQFESREVEKEYFAIVVGEPDRDRDRIDQPIGTHPYQREKMAVRRGHATSKDALTMYEVVERFRGFAALRVLPKTGRTHQIRLHLAHAGYPVLCDKLYGGRSRLTQGELQGIGENDVLLLERHALHARRLRISHPITGERLDFQAPLADDLETVLEALRAWRDRSVGRRGIP